MILVLWTGLSFVSVLGAGTLHRTLSLPLPVFSKQHWLVVVGGWPWPLVSLG